MNTHVQNRILLLGASLDTGNMGVNALAAGAITCLRQRFPDSVICFLDYAKAPSVQTLKLDGFRVSVPLIDIRFSKHIFLPNNIALLVAVAGVLKLIPSKTLRKWISARNPWIRQISEATAIASIAGGDSFSDIYGVGRFLYVSLPQLLALLLKRPLILLPQTVGPFRRTFPRLMARYILRRADAVYSREPERLGEIYALVGRDETGRRVRAFCYDVGFLLAPNEPSGVTPIDAWVANGKVAPVVGVNVSGLLLMGGYTRNNMFGLQVNYEQLISQLLAYLIIGKGATVVLIPHVNGGAESDVEACERIYASCHNKYPDQLKVVSGNYNASEIKYIIGRCEFFIGSRMHACIGALSQCVPMVAIAYSDKFAGTLDSLASDLIIDARKLPVDSIIATIGYSFENRHLTRRHLEERMPKIKDAILRVWTGAPASAPERSGLPFRSVRTEPAESEV